MEITKTFVNSFQYVLFSKLRWFFRRSIFRYAVSVALITTVLHYNDSNLEFMDKWLRGGIYFVCLCLAALALMCISAYLQSRHTEPLTITFTDENIIAKRLENSDKYSWDWIVAAEETNRMFMLQIVKRPRVFVAMPKGAETDLYISKNNLTTREYSVLRGWLVAHGKLSAKN